MCGRFALGIPRKKLTEHFGLEALPDAPARFNIAPTQMVEAVTARQGGGREARLFRWGLVPSWAKDPAMGAALTNARAETAAAKPAFRAAMARRRCLVMAEAFYEWRKDASGKTPFAFFLAGAEPMGLAGLWEAWHGPDGHEIESCAILTCAANALVAAVHDRMPVIVPPEAYGSWLAPGPAPLSVLVPYDAGLMRAHPVSRAVNSPARDGRELLDPVV